MVELSAIEQFPDSSNELSTRWSGGSVTKFGDLLDFEQLFKAFGNNYIAQISHILRHFFVKVSKSIIFLVKSFLGDFYRHLAIFFWSHWVEAIFHVRFCLGNIRLRSCPANTLFLFVLLFPQKRRRRLRRGFLCNRPSSNEKLERRSNKFLLQMVLSCSQTFGCLMDTF